MISRMLVEVLYARIKDGAFVPNAEQFPYAHHAAGVPQSKLAEQRQAYRTEGRRLDREVFKDEALVATGLNGHPKADKAFDLAYERGASCGLHEVLSELIDLAELLVD